MENDRNGGNGLNRGLEGGGFLSALLLGCLFAEFSGPFEVGGDVLFVAAIGGGVVGLVDAEVILVGADCAGVVVAVFVALGIAENLGHSRVWCVA